MSTLEQERDTLERQHPRDLPPEEQKPKTDKDIIADLQAKIRTYEQNGPMHLLYALNRKCNEAATLLNNHSLQDVAIEKGSDKTFERLKVTWNDSVSLANMVKELTKSLGASGNEVKDLSLPFIERIAKERP